MNILHFVFATTTLIFLYLMLLLLCSKQQPSSSSMVAKEGFCTCRGAQYNNSSADVNQANCYKNKIPARIWKQSYAGCTSFDDPGKISYDYNILEKQLPEFAGV